ncbi:MAG: CoA transferase [Rhodospirillaceae bacterium]|nr:CoA transferase [Rhodospirillaceae bacterium]HAA92635.1 CoA transferase [Rhodospirillaceae bacterium]
MTSCTPLDGIRVFELGASVAAPYGAWVLAQLGAEVIKVEKPGDGDDARHWGPPFWHGTGAMFHALNRDKKSITVNLRDDAELARLRKLILKTGDVVIQNMRPGKANEMGLGPDELTAEKPELIYANFGAFGSTGPYSDRPGYDPLMQAFGGLMSVTGEEGRPPVRVGTSIIDMGTGMWSVIGITAALREREITGKGGVVDLSLYETSIAWMTSHTAAYHAGGSMPSRFGSGMRSIVPYQAYECSDGFLVIAGANNSLFEKISAALGHPEWPEDERFKTNPDRVQNRDAINDKITETLKTEPRSHWQKALDDVGVPNAPIQNTGEMDEHPQTKALEIIQESPDGSVKITGTPISFDGTRPPFRDRAPEIGQHNDEIFGELD